MSDKTPFERPPFGQRDKDEPAEPFGSGARDRRERRERSENIAPTSPYPDLRGDYRRQRQEGTRPAPPPPEEAEAETVDETPPDSDDERGLIAPLPVQTETAEVEASDATLGAPGTLPGEHVPTRKYTRKEIRERRRQVRQAKTRTRPKRSPVPTTLRFWVMARGGFTIMFLGVFFATIFTWWTPYTFIPPESRTELAIAVATQASQLQSTHVPSFVESVIEPPTLVPTAIVAPATNRIGIVSGHRGIYPASGLPDPGATCADGTTEQAVNEAVAVQVVSLLQGHGYTVDLLDEWDPRLAGYRALAMVSIHSDSCEYINEFATGFKVASFSESATPEKDRQLVQCLSQRYAETTSMSFHASVTFDMTQYHTFREINSQTPGAIVEIGFLYLDRELLVNEPDVVALGVARGVLCYLRGELLEETEE